MTPPSFLNEKEPPDDTAELVLVLITLYHCCNFPSAWHDPSAAWLLGIKAEGQRCLPFVLTA